MVQIRHLDLRAGAQARAVRTLAFGGFFGGKRNSSPTPGGAESPSPTYATVLKRDGYELRLYKPYFAVCTPYNARDEGYLAISSYMDGDNTGKMMLTPTQPMLMAYIPGEPKRMSLFLHSERGSAEVLESPPAPAGGAPDTTIEVMGGKTVAVTSVTGNLTPDAAEQIRRKLLADLEADGISPSEEAKRGGFYIGQFGALYSLQPTRREITVTIDL